MNKRKKKKDHNIINTDTNGPKSVCWPEEIVNELISLALFGTENDHQIEVQVYMNIVFLIIRTQIEIRKGVRN